MFLGETGSPRRFLMRNRRARRQLVTRGFGIPIAPTLASVLLR